MDSGILLSTLSPVKLNLLVRVWGTRPSVVAGGPLSVKVQADRNRSVAVFHPWSVEPEQGAVDRLPQAVAPRRPRWAWLQPLHLPLATGLRRSAAA